MANQCRICVICSSFTNDENGEFVDELFDITKEEPKKELISGDTFSAGQSISGSDICYEECSQLNKKVIFKKMSQSSNTIVCHTCLGVFPDHDEGHHKYLIMEALETIFGCSDNPMTETRMINRNSKFKSAQIKLVTKRL